jgi:MFS family permease
MSQDLGQAHFMLQSRQPKFAWLKQADTQNPDRRFQSAALMTQLVESKPIPLAPPQVHSTPYLPVKRSLPFLVVISLFGLALTFTINILDPFIYTEKLRLLAPPAYKNTMLSFITITSLGVAFVVQPLIGRLSDHTHSRWGRRTPFLAAGVMGVSLALGLISAADSLWLLLAAVIGVAICTNTIQGPWQALIPDQVPPGQHGATAGIKTLLEAIGVITGLVVVGASLSQGQGWMAPLLAIALYWLILAITWRTLPNTPGLAQDNVPALPPKNPLKSLLIPPSPPKIGRWAILPEWLLKLHFNHLPPALPWWMLNRFLFWAAAISIRTFMLNYLADVHGLSAAQAQALSSQVLLVLGAGVLALVLPAGAIADRVGRRPLLIFAGLLAAAGALMFVGLADLDWLFLAGGLIAGGAGIFASASWSLVTNIVPDDESALYLGLANAATICGSVAGRMGGPVIDGLNQLTGSTTIGYLVVFGLATFCFIASGAVVLKIKNECPNYHRRQYS